MKKFTLITGSSSGIGREIAINLSKKNNIILSGTKSSELTKRNYAQIKIILKFGNLIYKKLIL